MDPTWLDQLLQYIKGPGLANAAGLGGVAGALNQGGASPTAGLPNVRSPSIVPPAGQMGAGKYGSPFSGSYGLNPGVPQGPPTSPVQLPVPAQTRSMVPAGLNAPPAAPGAPPGGVQFGAPAQPGGGLPAPYGPGGAGGASSLQSLGTGAASLMGKGGPLAALIAALKPQPAQGGPQPPQSGTPVTPLGPQPSAASTFNGNPFGSSVPLPMPRPAPMPANPPMPPMPPGQGAMGGPPPFAAPGIGGKGTPGQSGPYGYPNPNVTNAPDLIHRMINGLFGSPIAGGWNQNGQNTASGF